MHKKQDDDTPGDWQAVTEGSAYAVCRAYANGTLETIARGIEKKQNAQTIARALNACNWIAKSATDEEERPPQGEHYRRDSWHRRRLHDIAKIAQQGTT